MASAVLMPTGLGSGATYYGYGAFGAGYGGAGESLTYSGSSYFDFLALPTDGIYLDVLNFSTTGSFDSLSLNVSFGGSGVISQTFSDLTTLLAFISVDHFLGDAVDGLNRVVFSYSFTSSLVGSAFGFDYVLANGPYVPPPVDSVPLPFGWVLLMSALAALSGAKLLQRGRNGGEKLA